MFERVSKCILGVIDWRNEIQYFRISPENMSILDSLWRDYLSGWIVHCWGFYVFVFFWGLLVAGFCRILAIWILLVFIPARYSSPLGSSVARYDLTLFCSECNFLLSFTWTGLCKEYMLGVHGHKKVQFQAMERERFRLFFHWDSEHVVFCVSLRKSIRFICKHATKYFPIKVIFEDENAFDASRSYGEFWHALLDLFEQLLIIKYVE